MIYPNSTPEFRLFVKKDGIHEFQVRYVNSTQGYIGKWQPIKIEYEQYDKI